MKNPPQIGPWSTGWTLSASRTWFRGLEAARVAFCPKNKESPWVWFAWFADAAKAPSQGGWASSFEEAQAAADTVLRAQGYTFSA